MSRKDEFGFDLDFIADPISDVADGIGDVVTSIPGVKLVIKGVDTITGPVGDFIKGPMRDFARTGLGETIFRAFSVALAMCAYVVPVVGFTLAFLTWSIPGLAKGEQFMEALTKEFVYRVEYVVTVFGGKAAGEGVKAGVNKMMGDQLQRAVNMLQEQAKKIGVTPETLIQKSGLSPAKLAQMAGVRQDIAAYAIEWFKGQNPKMFGLINKAYNADGTMKAAVKKALETMTYPPGSPCAQLQALRDKGLSETSPGPMGVVFMQQKALCEEWQLNEAIRLAGVTDTTTPTLGKRKLPVAGATSGPSLESLTAAEQVVKLEQTIAKAISAGQKQPIIQALQLKLNAAKAAAAAGPSAALTSYPPTEVNAEDQSALLEYARKGAEQAATVPAISVARQLSSIPLYRFGFDVATGLCKGMMSPGPGQDRIANLLDGSKLFRLPDGTQGVGNAACVKGFRVGQVMQYGITKSASDSQTATIAGQGPDAAAGAFITAGLAGSGLPEDTKADIMTTVTSNPGAVSGATAVAQKKIGWWKRLLTWFGL